MTSDGTRTFEWDVENRLTAVVIVATGHRSEFEYDGLGRRVQIVEKDPDATQTLQTTSDKKYLWVGTTIAEERAGDDGGTVTKRFYAQGFVDNDGTILLYTRDHLGSIRELVDMSQTVRARYDYDPFGRVTKVSGDRDSVFLYTGHFWHAQTGLYLTLYRAYDANLGRWLSRDPSAEGGGINLYVYVGNNPINFTDPLGLCPKGWWARNWGKVAFVGAAVIITVVAIITLQPEIEALLAPIGAALGMGAAAATAEAPAIIEAISEVGPELAEAEAVLPQITQNAQNGLAFEGQVLNALDAAKNTTAVNVPSLGRAIPDIMGKNGITEIKNVINLSFTRQLQIEAAASEGPFSLIVSTRTETISGPLQNAVYSSGGTIQVFDSATGAFSPW